MNTAEENGLKAFQQLNAELDLQVAENQEEPSYCPDSAHNATTISDERNGLNAQLNATQDMIYDNTQLLDKSKGLQRANYDAKIYEKIDALCSEIFGELALIDKNFAKLSDFFNRQAELIAAGREPEYLSEEEAETAEFYRILAIASTGLSKILGATKMEFKLRTEVYPRLKKMARQKLSIVEAELPNCNKLMQDNWSDLIKDTDQPIQYSYYKKEAEYYDQVWKARIKSLRNSWFHLLYLNYLKALLTDWDNDIFSAPYSIPDMEDVNTNILFNLFSEYGDNKKSFTDNLSERITEVMQGKWDFIKLKEVILIKDKELLATLQTHRTFPFTLSVMGQIAAEGGSSVLLDSYYKNEAYKINHYLRVNAEEASNKRDAVSRTIIINGLLLTACCSLPIYTLISTGWSIFWTVVIAIIFMWRSFAIASGAQDRYNLKIEKINIYAQSTAHKQAGEGPKYKTIDDIINNKNKIWIYALIGFVIGLFIGGIGCIFGAIIGGAIGGSISTEEVSTDGSDWEEVETGSGILAKIILVLLIGLLCWEIFHYIL